MKILVVLAFAYLWSSFAYASPAINCFSNEYQVVIDPYQNPACERQAMKGKYRILLCSNNQGSISKKGEKPNFLRKEKSYWIYRVDRLHLSRIRYQTEILRIFMEDMRVEYVQELRSREDRLKTRIQCTGTLVD